VYRECTDDDANLLFFCSAVNYATLAVLLSQFFIAVCNRHKESGAEGYLSRRFLQRSTPIRPIIPEPSKVTVAGSGVGGGGFS
jgi:hypothetical protein